MISTPRKRGAKFLLLCAGAFVGHLQAAEVRLLDLREAQVRETVQAQAATGDGPRPLRLSVSAGVVQHVLLLSPNLSLGMEALALGSARPGASATAFEGELPNLPGSWARMTRTEAGWIGVWFDGARHYALDTARGLAGTHPIARDRPPATPMLYALADLRVDDKDFAGDTERPVLTGEELLDASAIDPGQPSIAAATLPTRRLSVALVADAELSALDGTFTEANMLARLNIIDGIFASQVGVRIAAASTTLLTAANQPFSGTNPSTLLQQLRLYRTGSGTQQTAGLSHLMTGRNLDERTVGIAYIEGLCNDRYGASLSEARSGVSFDALIAAHEIGHVFGAPHDGEGACASTPQDRLMATQINGNTTFSACSLEQMAPVVARAACLSPIDAADVSLGAPLSAQVALGQATSLLLTVRSEGNTAVQGVELQIELARNAGLSATANILGGSACQGDGFLLRCSFGSLAPGTVRTVQLSLLATLAGTQRATLRLAAANDALPGNNSSTVDLQIVEGADLSVSVTPQPERLDVGGTANATVVLRNLGLASAPRSALVVSLAPGVAVTGVVSANLACTTVASSVNCEPLDLASGASASIALSIRAESAGNHPITASVSSTRFDPQLSNNEATAQLTVTGAQSAPASTGSGGGGGGAGLLLALGLLAAARNRRSG